MKEKIDITPTEEMVKRIRSKNMLDILKGAHADKYHAWVIDGIFSEPNNPSLILAVFSLTTGGFDLEYAEALNIGDRVEYLQRVRQLDTSPGLEYVEELEYGELVIIGDQFLQAFEEILAKAQMPSSMVIFDRSYSIESVYLIFPSNIPPSVALRQIKTQATNTLNRNGH